MEVTKFINWNNALTKHFLEKNDSEEIFIFATEESINEIGEQEKVGGCKDFLNTVFIDRVQRRELIKELIMSNQTSKLTTQENRIIERQNILAYANLLADKFPGKSYYFSFVVMAIYAVSSLPEEIREIGGSLKKYLKNNIPGEPIENGLYEDTDGRKGLETLLKRLHHDYPLFTNKSLTSERYVGKLKYQLVLSPLELKRLKDAIYRSSIWRHTSDLSYNEMMWRIDEQLDAERDGMLKQKIQRSMFQQNNRDRIYRQRLSDILDTFDGDMYCQKNLTIDRQTNVEGVRHLAYAIYWGEDGDGDGTLKLLTDENETYINDEGYEIFPGSYDRLGDYNINPVIYKGSESTKLSHLGTLELGRKKFKSISQNEDKVVFFNRLNDCWYIQSRETTPGESFVAISAKCNRREIKSFEQWLRGCGGSIEYKYEDQFSRNLLGEGWMLFLISGVSDQYYRILDRGRARHEISEIEQHGGITIAPNTYLKQALPYFTIPVNQIDEKCLEINANQDDKLLEDEEIRFTLEENKIFLDYQGNLNGISTIDGYIEYKTEEKTSYKYQFSFDICSQEVKYNSTLFNKYGPWGNLISTDEQNIYISGNHFHGVESPCVGNGKIILPADQMDKVKKDDFYFLNLLAACCYANERSEITRHKFQKCVDYAISRKGRDTGCELLLDKDKQKELRHVLEAMGIITSNFQTGVKYQALPPTFVKIERSLDNGCNPCYMLTGCFTDLFLNDLLDFCGRKRISVSQKKESLTGVNEILPPVLLVSAAIKLDEFKREFKHEFEVVESDLCASLLNFSANVPDFAAKLTDCPNDWKEMFNLKDIQGNPQYPIVRENTNPEYCKSYYIQADRNSLKQLSEPEERVSKSWFKLYASWRRGDEKIIYDQRHNDIYIPNQYTFPLAIRRALFIMNLGHPKYVNVFLCNSNKKELYGIYKKYHLNQVDNTRLTQLVVCLTKNENIVQNEHVINCHIQRTYQMKLLDKKGDYKKRPEFKGHPCCLIKLLDQNANTTIAIASLSKFWYNNPRNQKMVGVNCPPTYTPNKFLSKIMTNPNVDGDTLGHGGQGMGFTEIIGEMNAADIYTIDETKYDIKYIKIL